MAPRLPTLWCYEEVQTFPWLLKGLDLQVEGRWPPISHSLFGLRGWGWWEFCDFISLICSLLWCVILGQKFRAAVLRRSRPHRGGAQVIWKTSEFVSTQVESTRVRLDKGKLAVNRCCRQVIPILKKNTSSKKTQTKPSKCSHVCSTWLFRLNFMVICKNKTRE